MKPPLTRWGHPSLVGNLPRLLSKRCMGRTGSTGSSRLMRGLRAVWQSDLLPPGLEPLGGKMAAYFQELPMEESGITQATFTVGGRSSEFLHDLQTSLVALPELVDAPIIYCGLPVIPQAQAWVKDKWWSVMAHDAKNSSNSDADQKHERSRCLGNPSSFADPVLR